ncbi:putative nucleotide-sugar transporter [Helianthus anomalus]
MAGFQSTFWIQMRKNKPLDESRRPQDENGILFFYNSQGLKVKKHSSYLMTVEMSLVGSLCLLASTYKSSDGEAIRQHGFFYGWTPLMMIGPCGLPKFWI